MEENKPAKKLEEAHFEVSSLAEVKDENGNGIFHLRTKTKFILAFSILILLAAGTLIYLYLEKYINAEIWQVALWGLCGVLAIYSMFAKSILAMLLNIILFAGVSFIPTWQSGYEFFRPTIEKFSEDAPPPIEEQKIESVTPQIETPQVEQPKIESPETKSAEEKSVELQPEEKTVEETPAEKNLPAQENFSYNSDLPSI